MKKTKIIIVLGMLVLNWALLYPQQSFDMTYGTEKTEFFKSTFEDDNGDYISMGGQKVNFGEGATLPLVVKTDAYGNVIDETLFSKQDTSYVFHFGFQKANGNYFVMGTLTDTNNLHKDGVSYFCELTPSFNLEWEKMYGLPQPYKHHQMRDFILDSEGNVLIQGIADSSEYSLNNLLFISKIDQEGNMLQFKMYDGWKDYGLYSAFMHNFDSTGFILLGAYSQNSFVREWVELDLDLEIINWVSVIDQDHYISTPLSAKWLPDGNLIMADLATMEPGANKDLYIKTMDQELNTVNDTLVFYDESLYLPMFNGLDYTDEDNIWLGAFNYIPPWVSGTEFFYIHILGPDGQMKGMKAYGGDTRYLFNSLIATSDGGCLMTGLVPDYDGADNNNGYIIKVMPGDITTNAEETPYENDMDVAVFPNPFSGTLHFKTLRQNLRASLTDNIGKEVFAGSLSGFPRKGITTGHLPPGFYYYTITDNGRTIQSGKLIKQ